MADDRHYVPGDWYRICDRTGFKVRQNNTQQEWTGRFIRRQSWEKRNDQDFVRGVPDEQYVPDVRPRQLDVFIGPLTTFISVTTPAGSSIIPVSYTVRMQIGDGIKLLLANGETFYTTIIDIPGFTSLQIKPILPYAVNAGSPVIDTTALAAPNIG
jgi:hypothetical protein